MDPITLAVQQLADDAEAFWRARPGMVLPLVAAEDEREHVAQALRLREGAADNRRPLVIHGAPFTTAETYFSGLAGALARHYEIVRRGVAEEGVSLPPFAGHDGTAPSSAREDAALAMSRTARLLGDGFDGLVVALVPEHVADAAGWREHVRALATTRWSPRVRLAVLSPPGGPLSEVLGTEGARLRLDAGKVLAFLRQVTPAAAPGPAERLRALLLGAAEALGAGHPTQAAATYEQARALCRAEDLPEQEAAVSMALGGAHLAGEAPGLAASAYREAAAAAQRAEAWALGCQAWLGAGGACLAEGDHVSAVAAFQAACTAAQRAGVTALQVEALRMKGTSLLHLERDAGGA